MKKLIINRVQCLLCEDIITSEHSHDFKTCKCGNLSIDGGNEYPRRLYQKHNSYQDLSEFTETKKTAFLGGLCVKITLHYGGGSHYRQ